jgi:hypothetical protein
MRWNLRWHLFRRCIVIVIVDIVGSPRQFEDD